MIFFFFFFQAEDGIRDYKVTGVQTCALPIFEGLHRKNITIVHAWGMTETSPLASLCYLRSYQEDLPLDEQFNIKAKQGTVLPGVDFRVVNMETGEEVPWDSQTFGELQVRGPWIARAYYADSEP